MTVMLRTRTYHTPLLAPHALHPPTLCLVPRPSVLGSRRLQRLRSCAAAAGHHGDHNPESTDSSSWAADNVSSGQMYHSNAYSHNLPWKEYSCMMFWAMELEVESNNEMKAAYGQENQQHLAPSSSNQQLVPDSAHLLPTTEFSRKINKAIGAHNAAVQFREAAEAEAQRFFEDVKASHASWAAAERDYARSKTIEIDEAVQTGLQMAKDKWIEAMRAARTLVKRTQQAVASCTEKLKLEMSLEPQESVMRRKQEAALQQLNEPRDDTMADLAAALTAQFVPSGNMSVAEARHWLEQVWHLDENEYENKQD